MAEVHEQAASAAQIAEPNPLGGDETERVRTRVRLMVEVTARRGSTAQGSVRQPSA